MAEATRRALVPWEGVTDVKLNALRASSEPGVRTKAGHGQDSLLNDFRINCSYFILAFFSYCPKHQWCMLLF